MLKNSVLDTNDQSESVLTMKVKKIAFANRLQPDISELLLPGKPERIRPRVFGDTPHFKLALE